MSGSVAPHSRLPILIALPLKKQAEHSFNLKFDVKHNSIPLVLNVKANSFLTDATLKIRNFAGEELEVYPDTKQKSEQTCANFGSVQLNEKSLQTLILSNDYLLSITSGDCQRDASRQEAVRVKTDSWLTSPHTPF